MEFFKTGDGRLHVSRILTLAYVASLAGVQLAWPRRADDPYLWLNWLQVVGWYIMVCRKTPSRQTRLREIIGIAVIICSAAGQFFIVSRSA